MVARCTFCQHFRIIRALNKAWALPCYGKPSRGPLLQPRRRAQKEPPPLHLPGGGRPDPRPWGFPRRPQFQLSPCPPLRSLSLDASRAPHHGGPHRHRLFARPPVLLPPRGGRRPPPSPHPMSPDPLALKLHLPLLVEFFGWETCSQFSNIFSGSCFSCHLVSSKKAKENQFSGCHT